MVDKDFSLRLEDSITEDTCNGDSKVEQTGSSKVEQNGNVVEKKNKDDKVATEELIEESEEKEDMDAEVSEDKDSSDVKDEEMDESADDDLQTKDEEDDSEKEEGNSADATDEESAADESQTDSPADGKRVRKKVERLVFASSKKEDTTIVQGSGVCLGEIEYINHTLNKTKSDDLKILHRIIFKSVGKSSEVKKRLRKFNGFAFKEGDAEYEQFLARIEKLIVTHLKDSCHLLGLDKKGTKRDICERLALFLVEPTDNGVKIPAKKKTKSKPSKKKASAKKTPSKKTPSKKTPKKAKKPNKAISEDEEEDEVSDQESDDFVNGATESPVKKVNKTPVKKTAVKTPAKKASAKKPPKTDTPSRKATPSRKRARVEESDDEDDEPILKKMKPKKPTNDVLKSFLTEYIKTVDLEEVTMKQIYQRVYDNYPDFDLSDRKDFIKTTVKTLIA